MQNTLTIFHSTDEIRLLILDHLTPLFHTGTFTIRIKTKTCGTVTVFAPQSSQLHCVCSPIAPVLSLLLGMLFSPAIGCALSISWVLGPFPGCFSFESIHACTACARHRRRCPRGHGSRGEAFVCKGFQTNVSNVVPSRSLGARLQSPLGCCLSHVCNFGLDFCNCHCICLTLCLMVSGHFSTNSALFD